MREMDPVQDPAWRTPEGFRRLREARGQFFTVTVVDYLTPQLERFKKRLEHPKEGFEEAFPESFFKDDRNYIRDDRLRGDTRGRRDFDGKHRNWSPGYRKYQRVEHTDRLVKLRSRRPYHPLLTLRSISQGTQRFLDWLTASFTQRAKRRVRRFFGRRR